MGLPFTMSPLALGLGGIVASIGGMFGVMKM